MQRFDYKSIFEDSARKAAAAAKLAVLLGQADARVSVKLNLPPPGSIDKRIESFSLTDGSYLYNTTLKDNWKVIEKIVADKSVNVLKDAYYIPSFKLNEIYEGLIMSALDPLPQVTSYNIPKIGEKVVVNYIQFDSTKMTSPAEYKNSTFSSPRPTGVPAANNSGMSTDGELLFEIIAVINATGNSITAAVVASSRLAIANVADNLYKNIARVNAYKGLNLFESQTLYERILFLDKISADLAALAGVPSAIAEKTAAAKIAMDIITMITNSNMDFSHLLIDKSVADRRLIATYLLFFVFDHKDTYNILYRLGVSNMGTILYDEPISDADKTIQFQQLEHNPLAKFVIDWIHEINQRFAARAPVDSPATENAPDAPDAPGTGGAGTGAGGGATGGINAADLISAINASKVDIDAINKGHLDAQKLLVEQANYSLDAAIRAGQETTEAVLQANLESQRELTSTFQQIAQKDAEEETKRELLRIKENERLAMINGATIVDITKLNAQSSNQVALANARAVSDASKNAAQAAIGSITAVLGPDGINGVLGTMGNMLLDQQAQQQRLMYEQEQMRQFDAARAAQKQQEAQGLISSMQYQERMATINREREASQQIQDLINKVSTLQAREPEYKEKKYSEILTKLATDVFISDKQSCRVEVSGKQSLNIEGDSNTIDGLVMKQKITTSSSCYQDAKKLSGLHAKITEQVAQFAKTLDPALLDTHPAQIATDAKIDVTSNYTTETMQDLISIANGNQDVVINAKNSIIKNITLDQSVDLYTQAVQQSITQLDAIRSIADKIDPQIETLQKEAIDRKVQFEKRKEQEAGNQEIVGSEEGSFDDIKYILYIIIAVILMALIGFGIYYYKKNKKNNNNSLSKIGGSRVDDYY
jgi:hypothetical protein